MPRPQEAQLISEIGLVLVHQPIMPPQKKFSRGLCFTPSTFHLVTIDGFVSAGKRSRASSSRPVQSGPMKSHKQSTNNRPRHPHPQKAMPYAPENLRGAGSSFTAAASFGLGLGGFLNSTIAIFLTQRNDPHLAHACFCLCAFTCSKPAFGEPFPESPCCPLPWSHAQRWGNIGGYWDELLA